MIRITRFQLGAEAFDQRPVEVRQDVLVYTSPPFEANLEVAGSLEAILWAASSAPDTNFTVKLVDVEPSGYARNPSDGITRLSRSLTSGVSFPLGRPVGIRIDQGATCNQSKSSHCVRLEISSSNFPRFDRNVNTGLSATGSVVMQTASQTILHNSHYPSRIILPIV